MRIWMCRRTITKKQYITLFNIYKYIIDSLYIRFLFFLKNNLKLSEEKFKSDSIKLVVGKINLLKIGEAYL